jgi:hypothetical protein
MGWVNQQGRSYLVSYPITKAPEAGETVLEYLYLNLIKGHHQSPIRHPLSGDEPVMNFKQELQEISIISGLALLLSGFFTALVCL